VRPLAASLSRRLLIRTSHSCGQSPRQFAGIRRANSAARLKRNSRFC